MYIERSEDNYYLIEGETKVALDERDIRTFKKLTPMGRKVIMRRRAMALLEGSDSDSEVKSLLVLLELPAKDWAFEIRCD